MPLAATASRPRLEADGALLRVSGDLTFATVTALLAQSRPLFGGGNEPLLLDLGSVGRVDSAGLALLFEWQRLAASHDRPLAFQEIPAQLLAIARASGVESLLPLQPPR